MNSNSKILKTYKIYIDGKFPRTESGRFYTPEANGKKIGHICLSSVKDFRNAVVAARKSQNEWAERTAFNKSQIVYRIAEMMEGKRKQFLDELQLMGIKKAEAEKEIQEAIDNTIYYAGWCDKFQQIFSSVNPVASSHFNFSMYEAQGVIGVICPEKYPLLGLVSSVLPVITGGNTCVVLASYSKPLCAVTFAEVLETSDLPAGVVNILTGNPDELDTHFSTHKDVDGFLFCGNKKDYSELESNCAENMKRFKRLEEKEFAYGKKGNPYLILNHQEVKTTWHPVDNNLTGGNTY